MHELNDDGGPAFPRVHPADVDGQVDIYHGMSMRDYFAANAINGWLSNQSATPVEAGIDNANPQDLAKVAALFGYMVADAMLEARK